VPLVCCGQRARAASTQKLQAVAASNGSDNHRVHSIIACSRHILYGCYSSRTSRSWWLHACRAIATVNTIRGRTSEGVDQCFSTLLLQRNLPQMFALLVEPCAMIQVSVLLQPHITVVANFFPGNFSLFWWNPWLKSTAVDTCLVQDAVYPEYIPVHTV